MIDTLDNPADVTPAGPSTSQPANPQPTSILDSPAPTTPQPQTWPDNWRQEMAGNDEKYLKQLERFNSPPDVYKSYREIQAKLSSQKPVIEKPGANATPEQIAAYRQSIGVPDDPSGYNLDFDDGTVIGEDIKPQIDGYLKFAHESNLPPDVVKSNIAWFMKDVQAQQEQIELMNQEARIEGIAALRSEWGAEYQGNINAVHALFVDAPEGLMSSLLQAREEGGLKFGNKPDNMKWLVNLAKKLNPQATLVPPGPDQAGSIDAEIEKITKMMNSPDKAERDKYWGNESMQKRFAALNQAKFAR